MRRQQQSSWPRRKHLWARVHTHSHAHTHTIKWQTYFFPRSLLCTLITTGPHLQLALYSNTALWKCKRILQGWPDILCTQCRLLSLHARQLLRARAKKEHTHTQNKVWRPRGHAGDSPAKILFRDRRFFFLTRPSSIQNPSTKAISNPKPRTPRSVVRKLSNSVVCAGYDTTAQRSGLFLTTNRWVSLLWCAVQLPVSFLHGGQLDIGKYWEVPALFCVSVASGT